MISSIDENNREVIIIGRGLGFGQKIGGIVDDSKIEKVFRMDTRVEIKQLENLLAEVPIEVIELSNEIIDMAKKQMGDVLQKSIYITLIDHINFVIERKHQNILFQNPLFYDVKRLYKEEYRIGKEAVAHINAKSQMDIPEDEAVAIALHLINAQLDKEMPEAINITKIVQNSIKIVQSYFNIELVEENVETEHFILHIKTLAERILHDKMMTAMDEELDYIIREKLVQSSACAEKITDYIFREYGVIVTPADTTELTFKIERVVTQNEADQQGKLADVIIENVGGQDNIINTTHCMTRIRFELKDVSQANTDILQNTEGIFGVKLSAGQYQVIVGKQVKSIFSAIEKRMNV